MAKAKKEKKAEIAETKVETVVETKEAKVVETPVETPVKAKEVKVAKVVKTPITGDSRVKLNGLIDLSFVNKYRADGKSVIEISELVADAAVKELSLTSPSERKIAKKFALQVLRK
tara:strand:+ start:635 stop:982 length:348 start_codon:yes stop_codon:yes gene_type:complete